MLKMISSLLKGAVLGPAMVIPGVSGGTMALILGIYDRLIKALHSFSFGTLRDALGLFSGAGRKERFQALLDRHDIKFLLTLLAGAVLAIFPSMLLIEYLFNNYSQPAHGFFLGLVGVSIIFPLRLMERKSAVELLCALAAIALAISIGINKDRIDEEKGKSNPIVTAADVETGKDATPGAGHSIGNCARFAFSGALASSAMLLPGISGSFLLVLLGVFHEVLNSCNPFSPGFDPLLAAIFIAGCICGLVLFARLINFLLERWNSPTMAFLGGLMAGSLWTLWPFRNPVSKDPAWPGEGDGTVVMTLLCILTGGLLIATLARYDRSAKEAVESQSIGR